MPAFFKNGFPRKTSVSGPKIKSISEKFFPLKRWYQIDFEQDRTYYTIIIIWDKVVAQKEDHMDIEQIVLLNILCNAGSILEYNI